MTPLEADGGARDQRPSRVACRRVLYFNVHDSEYPRNRLVRNYLIRHGYSVTYTPKSTRGGITKRTWLDLSQLWVGSRGVRVIVVSEFSLRYALPAWVVSKWRGATLAVDGFVGLYETWISDVGAYSRFGLRALAYRLIDSLARLVPDYFLVDTEVRASDAARRTSSRTSVVSLPVGSPREWPTPTALRESTNVLTVLYYGNYIHLHGVDTLVEAVARAAPHIPIRLTLLGNGSLRPEIEHLVRSHALHPLTTFLDPVPEAELPSIIAEHQLVAGIFGSSPKASTVIANKVWQGLACGRRVITRSSAALDEIAPLVGNQLVQVPPADAGALASALILAAQDAGNTYPEARRRLDEYVDERFADFLRKLSVHTARSSNVS
ncbi:glycosyltransferase family 4 protein [Blastococcus sp. MG754426]|uniref:glycosyltransferase n=1 Tax=unclassified Blastococcus TaxID=2619396 RepID=UPI001EF06CBD|nr:MULTISPECIES: glycosyltransferase [unclassified Blastococcus]MCF6508451.1 glycosyltransferase family 4 protein [Blastococcus sp. MG754426]MCF6513452.1 glycosyltransferase family 4 protein [Blastococcus sp. MG754427]